MLYTVVGIVSFFRKVQRNLHNAILKSCKAQCSFKIFEEHNVDYLKTTLSVAQRDF